MGKGFFKVPVAINEPVKSYKPGSTEREEVLATYKAMLKETLEVPMYINGKDVKSGNTQTMSPPHDHQHILGSYHTAEKAHVETAIATALEARKSWSQLPWEQRAGIFLRAAELIAGPYRAKINASTMIGQSKTVFQAEIDAACEFVDFLRFNVQFMIDIYKDQPQSTSAAWNRIEYRPLEGFTYAVSPFNFTSIAGNLPACMALMGNVVVWKPSDSQAYSAKIIMDIFEEAGVPPGVINVVFGDPVMITDTILASPDFSGLHFTGSTHIFKELWKQIGTTFTTTKHIRVLLAKQVEKILSLPTLQQMPSKLQPECCVVLLNFKVKNVVQLQELIFHKSLWPEIKAFLLLK